MKKIILTITFILALTSFWFFADTRDYFQADYNDLTAEESELFKWRSDKDSFDLSLVYRQHFADTEYIFPRQKVSKIKIFKNVPIIGSLSSKTLKNDQLNNFLKFCNDTSNFDWGETTWAESESEYYCRLYNADNKVIGKIYFCLDQSSMTSARPFSPTMKFGQLSKNGLDYITQLIGDNDKWD
jgi:hypothetical protein